VFLVELAVAVRLIISRSGPSVLEIRRVVEISDAALTAICLAVLAILMPLVVLLERMCKESK
jgi:cyanate permease